MVSRRDDDEELKEAVKRDGFEWEIWLGIGVLALTFSADFFSSNPAPFQLGKITIGYVIGAGGLLYGLWNRFL